MAAITLNKLRELTWNAATQAGGLKGPLPYNPDFAIPKRARELAEQGQSLGLPVTDEYDIVPQDGGGRAQGFSTGLLLHWNGTTTEVK